MVQSCFADVVQDELEEAVPSPFVVLFPTTRMGSVPAEDELGLLIVVVLKAQNLPDPHKYSKVISRPAAVLSCPTRRTVYQPLSTSKG